jgi:hypothetical protein
VLRPLYEEDLERQITEARTARGPGDLEALVTSGGSWTVE